MKLFPIKSDDTVRVPSKWSQKEKDQYRFGGVRYSFRGPEYPSETIPQIEGLYPFPKNDGENSN